LKNAVAKKGADDEFFEQHGITGRPNPSKRDLYFRGDRKDLGILGNRWLCRVSAYANAVRGNCGGARD
jgi:hypothetical protein